MANEVLFSGRHLPLPPGGLSNEKELIDCCPSEFKLHNPWSTLAMRLYFEGGHFRDHWKFKEKDADICRTQLMCLEALLDDFYGGYSSPEDRAAIGGWMLSEMLEELPVFIL